MLHFLRNEVILSDFPFLGLSSLCKKERKNFSWRVYFALKFPSFPSILQRWEGTQRCYLKRYGKPRKGSEEAKLELVERFQPTIRANAWKLNREDGKEEMTLAFLEILESMNLEKLRSREDGVIVAYFKNALRHAYCHKVEESIKQPSVAFSIDNTEEQEREAVLAQDGWNTAGKDRYFFTLFEGCSELTEKEKEVLTLIYYAGYSATEIAAAWGTSKQNVNQIKRRGLGKLKKSLQGEFF